MANQPQQSIDGLTFQQRMALAEWAAFFGALTVMPILRRNVGYRLLKPGWVLVSTAMMFLVAAFVKHTPYAENLKAFAFFFFVIALSERFRRWRELRRGVHVHTYYLGDSRLEWLTPKSKRHTRPAARNLEPLLCAGAGFVIYNICPAVGGWLIFAGFCLNVVEHRTYKRERERTLDTLDGLVESEVQSDAAADFSGGENHHNSSLDSTPLSSGLAADVQRHINSRKGKGRRPPGA
jgi:hypothetical protein